MITKRKLINHMFGSLAINLVGTAIIALLTSPWVMIGPLIFYAIIRDLSRFIDKEQNSD